MPRTDQLLADPRLAAAQRRLGRALVKAAITRAQERARKAEITPEQVADAAVAELPAIAASLTPVINATGVLVHTNLGRAPLTAAAGRMRGRGRHLRRRVRPRVGHAPGSAAAGAIERSGRPCRPPRRWTSSTTTPPPWSWRPPPWPPRARRSWSAAASSSRSATVSACPTCLTSTGARLREVGTTNRTTAADYADAIGPQTGFVLKVHPSNYRIEGFTASASVPELAPLSVPVVGDIGSGLLAPHPLLPDEPTPLPRSGRRGPGHRKRRQALGGPQAGLLLGRATWSPPFPAPPGPRAAGRQADPRAPLRPRWPGRRCRWPRP